MTLEKVEARIEERPSMCPGCHKTFTQTRHYPGFTGTDRDWMPHMCESCRAGRAEMAAASLEEAVRSERFERMGVPPMFRDASAGTWFSHGGNAKAVQARARGLNWMDAYDRGGEDIPALTVLSGPPGSGKTFWAWVIAKHVGIMRGKSVSFTLFDDVIRDLRGAWGDGDGGPPEVERLNKYRRTELLVLDEVSRHAVSAKSVQAHLYQLVAVREQWYRPTILTTNETGKELSDLLGPALVSRMTAWDGLWSFVGIPDFRVVKRNVKQHKGGTSGNGSTPLATGSVLAADHDRGAVDREQPTNPTRDA